MNHLPQIITNLTDNDYYKYTMGQMFVHQFPDATCEWTYKNRDPERKFTREMIDEINYQLDLYSRLRYTQWELDHFAQIDHLKADYIKLGIDPKTKTLLFSDSLDFERAAKIYAHFKDRINVAFGIGTWLLNDTGHFKPMNQVIKLTEVNGIPVCKISDAPGKYLGKSEEYHQYLQRAIDYRVKNHIVLTAR